MHIPKTAGTSFRMALQKQLDASMLMTYLGRVMCQEELVCQFHGRVLEELAPQDAETLVNYCEDNAIDCIHGHFSMFALRDLFDSPMCLTFIREPVGRLVSAYNHMFITMPDAANRLSFEQFVRLDRTRNVYEALGLLEYIDDFKFIGLTEQYDRSLALLERTFPALGSLAIEKANVSQKKQFSRSDIDPAFMDELQALNEADFEIYETVSQWFDEECEALGV